jgi:hypothetical protein
VLCVHAYLYGIRSIQNKTLWCCHGVQPVCFGTRVAAPSSARREFSFRLMELHTAGGNNLAQIQREREEAEKAAREELKKKQKTDNGGTKAKAPESQPKPEDKASPAAPALATMNLFDSANESELRRRPRAAMRPSPIWGVARRRTTTTTHNNNDVQQQKRW